jgi:hypothetical protein
MVCPKQTENLPRFNLKGDIFNALAVTVFLRDFFRFDYKISHASLQECA